METVSVSFYFLFVICNLKFQTSNFCLPLLADKRITQTLWLCSRCQRLAVPCGSYWTLMWLLSCKFLLKSIATLEPAQASLKTPEYWEIQKDASAMNGQWRAASVMWTPLQQFVYRKNKKPNTAGLSHDRNVKTPSTEEECEMWQTASETPSKIVWWQFIFATSLFILVCFLIIPNVVKWQSSSNINTSVVTESGELMQSAPR